MAASHAENIGAMAAFPSITTVSLNLTLVRNLFPNGKEHMMRLDFDSRFSKELREWAADKEVINAVPKSLLRKKLVLPSAGPRAKLLPGFGEFFRGETVEPLRCSGAGVEDSRYLYVKFSFRF
jgi:hypothetical protein